MGPRLARLCLHLWLLTAQYHCKTSLHTVTAPPFFATSTLTILRRHTLARPRPTSVLEVCALHKSRQQSLSGRATGSEFGWDMVHRLGMVLV